MPFWKFELIFLVIQASCLPKLALCNPALSSSSTTVPATRTQPEVSSSQGTFPPSSTEAGSSPSAVSGVGPSTAAPTSGVTCNVPAVRLTNTNLSFLYLMQTPEVRNKYWNCLSFWSLMKLKLLLSSMTMKLE